MGFFSWLTTSEKAVDTGLGLVKSMASGIDVMVLTDEEKIQYKAKSLDQWIKIQGAIAGENTQRSITRRLIAKLLVSSQMILLFWAAAVFPLSVVYAKFILELAVLLMPWVGGIVAFYFVYYGVQGAVEASKK